MDFQKAAKNPDPGFLSYLGFVDQFGCFIGMDCNFPLTKARTRTAICLGC